MKFNATTMQVISDPNIQDKSNKIGGSNKVPVFFLVTCLVTTFQKEPNQWMVGFEAYILFEITQNPYMFCDLVEEQL